MYLMKTVDQYNGCWFLSIGLFVQGLLKSFPHICNKVNTMDAGFFLLDYSFKNC